MSNSEPLDVIAHALSPTRGLTPNEAAEFLRMGPDRIRALIHRGELGAVNTAPTRCGRPRFVILPEHLAAFVKANSAAPAPKRIKRKKKMDLVDYFP